MTYDELGRMREATDFGGLVAGTEFDRSGRERKTFEDEDAAGATAAAVSSETTVDADGKPASSKDRKQAASSSLGLNQPLLPLSAPQRGSSAPHGPVADLSRA